MVRLWPLLAGQLRLPILIWEPIPGLPKCHWAYASTSDIFITGAIINSSNGFVKKNSQANSVVKGIFYSNKNFSDQWAYAMAAYQTQFAYGDIDDAGAVASINGTYRAGTPTTILTRIVSGGTGNGGNNYTGSPSNQNVLQLARPQVPMWLTGEQPVHIRCRDLLYRKFAKYLPWEKLKFFQIRPLLIYFYPMYHPGPELLK